MDDEKEKNIETNLDKNISEEIKEEIENIEIIKEINEVEDIKEENDNLDIEASIEHMDEVIDKALDVSKTDNKNLNIKGVAKTSFNIKKKIIIISSICIILSIIILFFVIMLINKLNSNVYKNVYALNIDFSGNTSNAVIERLKSESEKLTSEYYLDIYQNEEKIYTIKAQDIEFEIDIEKTAQDIMDFGRNKNLLYNNLDILKALVTHENIEVTYTYNKSKLGEAIKNVDLSIKDRFVDDSYSVDEKKNKLIITRGKKGNSIDYESEKVNIIKSFEIANTNANYKLNLVEKTPIEINLDEVYTKVKKEPKDGYIDLESRPVKFVSEENGYDFDLKSAKILLAKAENQKDSKVIEISLNTLEPKVKLKDLTYNLYKEKIAGYTTYFDTGSPARVNNLNVALSYLNGKVVMPGETFSYNDAIGSITASKGYQDAATFKAGEVVMELGGGICQTTSTLYNVALMANLEIVERHQHGLPVGYVPPSRDATVYSPILDFKFKNTRNYPIKIITSFSYSGNLNISFYGTKEETEYQISLTSNVLSKVPISTKYIYDDTLPKGTEEVVSEGVEGYVSESYITKSLDGKVVSSTLLSKDTYAAQQKVIKVGTK